MISVIVPVYNVEKYLRKCVESILDQTHTDLEVILVDDGSPDNSPRICDEFAQADSRVKVTHQTNGGLSCARNAGLDIATGEYVGFVDGDDTINPMMFESLLRVISYTGAEISMCGCKTVTSNDQVLATDEFGEGDIYKGKKLVSNIVIPLKTASWNKLFKRSVINDIRFPNGRIHGEDLVFFMKLLTQDTRIATTNYIGYNYFKRCGSITTSSFNERSFDEIWCKDKAAEIMKDKFPTFEVDAIVWTIRARMNVLRALTKTGHKKQYMPQMHECGEYVKTNYGKVKDSMHKKEMIEYILFRYFRPLYECITKEG